MRRVVSSRALLYGLFYAVFYGFHAVNRSFFPLYFQQLGFSPFQIALITSSEDISNLLGPILAVQIAQYLCSPRRLVVAASVLALLVYLPLFSVSTFLLVFLCWLMCIVSSKAPLVLVDTAAIHDSHQYGFRYGRLRIAGSLGFIVVTFLLGYLLDCFGTGVVVLAGWVMLGALCAAAFAVRDLVTPDFKHVSTAAQVPLRTLSYYPEWENVFRLLLSSTLLWASMSVFYTYFSIYLKELGWGGNVIAVCWGLSVLVEVVMLNNLHHLEERFTTLLVLQVSLLFVTLRWLILSWTTSIVMILLSQTLHAFVIAGFQMPSMRIAHLIFPAPFRGRAQGILSSVGLGFGLLVGRVCAGSVALAFGEEPSYRMLFAGSAMLSFLSYLVSRRLVLTDKLDYHEFRG